MKKEFYGIVSLLFVACAAIIGLLSITSASVEWAIIYLLILIVCPFGILLSYCAKCRCSNECSHVIPGFIVKYLPKRNQTGYSIVDTTTMAVCVASVLLFPQIWLIGDIFMLMTFWILAFIGFIIIQLKVCPSCKNTNCLLCPSRNQNHE